MDWTLEQQIGDQFQFVGLTVYALIPSLVWGLEMS